MLADTAAALTHAHERGVVHCDVKPSNILVPPVGPAKVGDFGVAELLRSNQDAESRRFVGTPGFMAPEQITGDATGPRTDAYAFAATAYLLLTGRPVFDHSDRRELLDAHLLAAPVPPAAAVRGFPAAASNAIAAGLAKDARDRATVNDIATALAQADPAAYPALLPRSRVTSHAADPPQTEGAERSSEIIVVPHKRTEVISEQLIDMPVFVPSPVARRRPLGYFVAAVVLIIVVGVGCVLLLSRGHGPSLQLTDQHVDVAPVEATCPRATYVFTGVLALNGGAGSLVVRWLRPDGKLSSTSTVAVAHGTREQRVQLSFVLSGTTATDVAATLEILSPSTASVRSPTAHFRCAKR